MLRSGYSSDAIQKDLRDRRFIGSCDAEAEKSLKSAGAAPALIDALRNGSYNISAEQEQLARSEFNAQAQRRAVEAEQARKSDTLFQDQVRMARAHARPTSETPSVVANLIKGDLVCWKDGSVTRLEEEAFANKSLIALYFSARWCSPCRKFTPKLVDFYNRISQQHPEFEVIFVSRDHSPGEMETYMREDKMPWPAVDFGKQSSKAALRKYSGSGIPCLVLVDGGGNVISDSYSGGEYRGPDKVLADIDTLLLKGSLPATARR